MGSGCISDFAVIVHRQYPAKRVAENEMNGNILTESNLGNLKSQKITR